MNETFTADKNGYYGEVGGAFVPEMLRQNVESLRAVYHQVVESVEFQKEFTGLLRNYAGRPSPLFFANRLSDKYGAKIYLKREDLNHTGSHKINNTIGQILLAENMGKTRIIAETGAGQHGVATATVAALLKMECEIFMGLEDTKRQALNVVRMKLLGAKLREGALGTQTLKDAMNGAVRDWITNVRTTFYIIGSVAGPHPYPMLVRDFQSVIGEESKRQIIEKERRLPDLLIACVGGGSNAMGLFYPFLDHGSENMLGYEAAGLGLETGEHAATLYAGRPGVLHGSKTYLLQNEDGQVKGTHSIAPGLDYPGVGPEHSYLKDSGRGSYTTVTDKDALEGFKFLSEKEGIIPALESAHAVAYTTRVAPTMPKDSIIIICLSGRGDKDIQVVAKALGMGV